MRPCGAPTARSEQGGRRFCRARPGGAADGRADGAADRTRGAGLVRCHLQPGCRHAGTLRHWPPERHPEKKRSSGRGVLRGPGATQAVAHPRCPHAQAASAGQLARASPGPRWLFRAGRVRCCLCPCRQKWSQAAVARALRGWATLPHAGGEPAKTLSRRKAMPTSRCGRCALPARGGGAGPAFSRFALAARRAGHAVRGGTDGRVCRPSRRAQGKVGSPQASHRETVAHQETTAPGLDLSPRWPPVRSFTTGRPELLSPGSGWVSRGAEGARLACGMACGRGGRTAVGRRRHPQRAVDASSVLSTGRGWWMCAKGSRNGKIWRKMARA